MFEAKLKIQICRSCGRDNAKSQACFRSEDGIRSFYEPRLRTFWGSWATLEVKDCLTNCDTPNSVRVCRGEKSFDFAWISTAVLADELLRFAAQLKSDATAKPSGALCDHLLDKQSGRGKAPITNPLLQPAGPKPVWLG